LIVLMLSVVSYLAQNVVFAKSADAVSIQVIGHQWWWEVKYDGPTPDQSFTTANEIRVPVGKPVRARLESRDVIHSFWVPSLNGKMDLITGQTNETEFKAERPGVYRGQCAEFCGLQHALMALEVIALPADQYEAWRSQQLKSPRVADDPVLAHGDSLFRAKGCGLCHTISGTPAGGKIGPDLTHVGGRRTIGAGTLPMTAGNLAGWIVDPQHIKPGNKMPAVPLAAKDLDTLVSYLEALK
jgi:cytochrome c oxidase subunit 2